MWKIILKKIMKILKSIFEIWILIKFLNHFMWSLKKSFFMNFIWRAIKKKKKFFYFYFLIFKNGFSDSFCNPVDGLCSCGTCDPENCALYCCDKRLNKLYDKGLTVGAWQWWLKSVSGSVHAMRLFNTSDSGLSL
jgi:hypothetical protein